MIVYRLLESVSLFVLKNNEHCTTGGAHYDFWIKSNQNSRCRLRVIKGDFSDEDKGSFKNYQH
jgi:hypothetical protein